MEIKGGLAHVLDQIEREKGIKKEEILQMIEQALISAYRKHAGDEVHVEARVNTSGEITASVIKTVVSKVNDSLLEVGLEEARRLDPLAAIGGQIRYPIDTEEFGRIAAQTAKQVLTQKIRETERESVFEEFKPKEGTMVNGTVHRFVNRNIIVDLGRAEGVLPIREQVRRERWTVGERIRALIFKVEKGPRGPEIILTRAHEDFIKKLFEQEVPEIYEKTVHVVAVVREAGQRSKIVVRSTNPKVDPIGACVGVKGSRVRPIINELQGERIDLVAESSDPATFIASSLAPAKPLSVTLVDPDKKKAEAIVSDESLLLAVGKNGQNVRLASRLTGWNIEVKTESQRKLESQASLAAAKKLFIELEGVGPRIADVLIKGGMGSLEKVARAKVEDLTVFSGIGDKIAEKLIESANDYLKRPPTTPKEVVSDGPAIEEPPHEPSPQTAEVKEVINEEMGTPDSGKKGDVLVSPESAAHVKPAVEKSAPRVKKESGKSIKKQKKEG
ncbi:MAG: transcription termination factor NusA [Elusimicrobia bacterium]|nr:transcription termination factor NusA [Candidatus Obscuribacterium magneticum]